MKAAQKSSCMSFLHYFQAAISNHMSEKPNTGQPRYSTCRYNTNSDITQSCFGPHFYPKPPFFLFYNMKSSHIEKNLSYRLVYMVEISVNTVVAIMKMGLSRNEVYQKD